MMSNAAFSTDSEFQAACQAAGIPPTAAQASKYRRGYGIAYTTKHGLKVGSKVNYKRRPEAEESQRAFGKPGKVDFEKGLGTGPYLYDGGPKPKEKAKLTPMEKLVGAVFLGAALASLSKPKE